MPNSIPVSHSNDSALSTEPLVQIDFYNTTAELVSTLDCTTTLFDMFPCTEAKFDYIPPDEDFSDEFSDEGFILPVSAIDTYDSNGNLLSSFYEYDWDGDGTIDARYQSVNTYDSDGNLLTSLSEDDWDGDGVADSSYMTTNTYDSNGNLLTSLSEGDWDGDGTIDTRYQSVNTYDSDGNLLTSLSESDGDGDGVADSGYMSTNTYDGNGNLLTSLSESDWDGDGTIDNRYQSVNTYDSDGNLLTSLSESDWDGDGTTDYRFMITNTYDSDRSLLSSLFEVDENGDGQIDYSSDLLIYPIDLAQDSVPRQVNSDLSEGNGADPFVLFPCYISPDENFLDDGIVATEVDSSYLPETVAIEVDSSHLPEIVATEVDSSYLPEIVATEVDSSYLPETLDFSDSIADTQVEQETWLSSSFSALEGDQLIRGVQVEPYALVGSDGDDILIGGRGRDRHWGGLGSDTFVFKKGDLRDGATPLREEYRPDKILDFEVGIDVISLTKVFRGNQFGSDQPFEDYVRIKGSSSRTVVQIDLNGDKSGSDFKNLVVLKGVDFETVDADSFLV